MTLEEVDGKLEFLLQEIRLLREQLRASELIAADVPVAELLGSVPELAAVTDADLEEAERSLGPDAVMTPSNS